MKNIIVGLITLGVFGIMAFLASTGSVFQGGEQGKVTKNMSTFEEPVQAVIIQTPLPEDKTKENEEQLKALQDKAGSTSSFGVSKEYKTRCASCHGVNGKGIIGPNISGKSAEFIYTKLLDYKAGRLENPVMKGLVMNLSKETLKTLADEIGTFKQAH
jgi:cytochrome c553